MVAEDETPAASEEVPAPNSALLGEETDCGWFFLRPQYCQRFRNPKCVLFWLCCAATLQGVIVNGFVNTVISSLEKRFEISSTEAGIIASSYDVGFVIFAFPISYFGGLGTKPRYLSMGIFLLGIGSLIFALPHFTTEHYVPLSNVDITCSPGLNRTDSCIKNVGSKLRTYKYVFYLGQVLNGIGTAPLYTLGVTYLDDNLSVRLSSLYVGFFYMFSIIGSSIGYAAGGEFLKLYTDFGSVDTTLLAIDHYHPRWVGAWWLGFLMTGILSFFVAAVLSGFPRALPGTLTENTDKYEVEKKEDQNQSNKDNISIKSEVSNMILSTRKIVLKPTFIALTISAAIEDILVGGFSTFGPKFIEYQFSLASSSAGQYIGLAAILAGGGGTLCGGYLVKKYDLKLRGIIRLCIGSSTLATASVLVFLINCENVLFAGVNIRYGQNPQNREFAFLDSSLNDTCNAHCGCTDQYYPVCGMDSIMYFSPCYAGCSKVSKDVVPKYSECNCINYNSTKRPMYSAVFGKCQSSCTLLPVFLIFFSLTMFFTFLTSVPALTATLRSVPKEQKSFALGIQWIIARCLGSIPAPILFGKIIDSTCELWQTHCDEQGSCFFYDNVKMSNYLFALGMALKVTTLLFYLIGSSLHMASAKDDDVVTKNASQGTMYSDVVATK